MTAMTIGDLAKRTGTTVETIRYYEKVGLLPAPLRTQGNYRAYDEGLLGRLSFVRRARDLGFSLDQIRELLKLADEKDRSCDAVDAIARQHLDEIDRKIADLTAMRGALADIVGHCGQGTVADCLIIEALAPKGE